MADNFLEKHREAYEQKKIAFLRKKRHLPKMTMRRLQRPEDDAL